MADSRTFLNMSSSQLVVVGLLVAFILVGLLAMCTTSGGTGGEMSWNGMWVEGMGADTMAAMGIPGNVGGVMVEHAEGPAARAGVQSGDVLQGINNIPVRDMAGFSEIVRKTDLSRGGVQLIVNRRGMQIPILVSPGGGGGVAQAAPGQNLQSSVVFDQRWLGIDGDALTPLQRNALGIPAGVDGVIIDIVTSGGRADQAGLAGNDVIVSVNGQRIASPASLWNTLASLDGVDRVDFGIYRNGQLVSIPLPAAPGTLVGGFGMPGWGCWGIGPGPACPVPAQAYAGPAGVRGAAGRGMLQCPQCGTTVSQPLGASRLFVPCPSCNTLMVWVP